MNIQPFQHHRILIPTLVLSVLALTSCGGGQSKNATEPSIVPTTKSSPTLSSASPSPVVSKTTPESGMGMKPKADGTCAKEETIKGKLTKNGNKIIHEPGSLNYEKVKATECFKTAADAEKAGYRPMKSGATSKDSVSKTKN